MSGKCGPGTGRKEGITKVRTHKQNGKTGGCKRSNEMWKVQVNLDLNEFGKCSTVSRKCSYA